MSPYMKILVIIPTLGFGGAERLLVTLLPLLKKKGYQIKLCIFNKPDNLSEELTKNGIEFINLNTMHRWSLVETLYKLRKEIRIFKPDILWSHLYFGILYSRLVSILCPKISVITVLHDSLSSDYTATGPWYKFRMWLYKKSKKFDSQTFAVSKTVAQEYKLQFAWQGIEVIYNAIDLQKIDSCLQDNTSEKQNVYSKTDESEILIVTPGRLDKRKGHIYLVDAIYKLKPTIKSKIKVLFIGDGPEKSQLIEYINKRNLSDSIKLCGNLEQSQLFQILNMANFVVIPSLQEPFGIVAIEAMYLQKPIIVTCIDGLKEITTDQYDAMQVPIQDSSAIADSITTLISHPKLADNIAKQAKITARQYDAQAIIKKWTKVFEKERLTCAD